MWNKFRQFVTDLAPPYQSDYMDRHAEMQAAYYRLRDEFAMSSLSAIIQNKGIQTPLHAAEIAYAMADAMMKARGTDK